MTEEKSLNELLDMDLEAVEQDGKAAGKRNLKILLVIAIIVLLIIMTCIHLSKVSHYDEAIDSIKRAGEEALDLSYSAEGRESWVGTTLAYAIRNLEAAGGYKDSKELIKIAKDVKERGIKTDGVYEDLIEKFAIPYDVKINYFAYQDEPEGYYDILENKVVYTRNCFENRKDYWLAPADELDFNIVAGREYICTKANMLTNSVRDYFAEYEVDVEFIVQSADGEVLFKSVNGEVAIAVWASDDGEDFYDQVYTKLVALLAAGQYQQAYDYCKEGYIDGLLAVDWNYKDLYDYYWYACALAEHTQDNPLTSSDIEHISKISAGFKDADTKLAGIRNANSLVVGIWKYLNKADRTIFTLHIYDGMADLGYQRVYSDGDLGSRYGIWEDAEIGWVTKDGTIKYAFSKYEDITIVPNDNTLNLKYSGHKHGSACGTYTKS